jgi:uncharacterized protein (TIGR03083 family)
MSVVAPTFDYVALQQPMMARLAALARSLSPTQWRSPSLCTGWRVCDVYGHMTYGGVTPMYRVVPRLLFVYRGNLNRGSAVESVRYADTHDQAELIAEFERSSADPVGIGKRVKPNELYVDHIVHELDVRRPLGLTTEWSRDELLAAIAAAVGFKSPLIAPAKKAAGLRIVATDLDWTHGLAGSPTVEGPAEDLLLAVCGRPAGLATLTGDGVSLLAARIG